jgi:hypothetical protein
LRGLPTGEPAAIPRTQTDSSEYRPLHPLAWAGIVGGGLIGIVVIALLGVQLAVLKNSREHIRSQDAKVTALYDGARSAVSDARPLARRVAPLARQARRALGTVNSLPPAVRAAESLAAASLPLVRALSAVGTPDVVARADALLQHVAATDVVAKAARAADLAPTLIALQQHLLRVQLVTLRIQRESLHTQLITLAVQREALGHIESIDRKTGGQMPPAPVAAP